MREYSIDGETYYVSGDRMYVVMDEEHGLEEIDAHAYHLWEYDDGTEYLVRLEWRGEVFDQVKIVSIDGSGKINRYVRADDFEAATPVRRVVPDGVHECPECGSWAGAADKDLRCLHCGYGISVEEGD